MLNSTTENNHIPRPRQINTKVREHCLTSVHKCVKGRVESTNVCKQETQQHAEIRHYENASNQSGKNNTNLLQSIIRLCVSNLCLQSQRPTMRSGEKKERSVAWGRCCISELHLLFELTGICLHTSLCEASHLQVRKAFHLVLHI